MKGEPLTGTSAPRFPAVALEKGHYESFYLRACHPSEPLGVWIRYTVHKRPGSEPTASLWLTLFERGAGGPTASKVTFGAEELGRGDGDYIRIGSSRFAPASASGRARSSACDARWELQIEGGEGPLEHLPRAWMYRAALPRTKLLSPRPAARFSGTLSVDGRRLELDRWPGVVGHNWGAEHAERWIWLHGVRFDEDPGAWLDVAIGRIRLGPVTVPWIANGCLAIGGVRHRLGGVERARSTAVEEGPTRCSFALEGRGIAVRGLVEADARDFVGWLYADPDGSEHRTVNCSIASMALTVERRGRTSELRTAHGAAYELGMREEPEGIPVEPFPDGAISP